MTEHEREEALAPEENPSVVHGYGPWPLLSLRCTVGGIAMGLANLVPGVSGGTMLLATGVYTRFVQAVAELSRFKFRRQSLFVLAVIGVAALATIGLLSGTVRTVTVESRWMMYSLFIGFTFGGLPVLWGLARPINGQSVAGFLVTLAFMIFLSRTEAGDGSSVSGFGIMFVAGVVGMSAMILPGISGSYLLVLMGAYLPILDAIDRTKTAMLARDLGAMTDPVVTVVLPVALGCVLSVLVLSNAIEQLLERFEKPTLGGLMGFLVGSVFGLYPFREFYRPSPGERVGGLRMTPELISELPQHKWPTRAFEPSASQIGLAVLIGVLGFLLTALLAKYFNREPSERAIDIVSE